MSKAFKWGCLHCAHENSAKRFCCTKCGKGKQWKREQIAEMRTRVLSNVVSADIRPETTQPQLTAVTAPSASAMDTRRASPERPVPLRVRTLTDCSQLSLKYGPD